MPEEVRAAKWVVPAVMLVVFSGRGGGGGKVGGGGERERDRGSWVRMPVVSGMCQLGGGSKGKKQTRLR